MIAYREAFEVQLASGGVWKTILTTSSNNLNSTKYFGPAVSGHVMRIRMSQVLLSLSFRGCSLIVFVVALSHTRPWVNSKGILCKLMQLRVLTSIAYDHVRL